MEAKTEAWEQRNKKRMFIIVALLSLATVLTYLMNDYYIYISAYAWFGVVYGMCLQYGRFCFASAFRDLFAVGVPRMVVGIMISMIFFAFVSSYVSSTKMSTFHAAPVGFFMVIAGFIFGVGMVFAGGCASGSLYKSGEGSGAAMLVLLSISITQSIFVTMRGPWVNALVPQSWHDSAVAKGLPAFINAGDGWMDQYLAGYAWNFPNITFARWLGWTDESVKGAYIGNTIVGVVIPALLLLLAVYFIWVRKGFMKKRAEAGLGTGPGANVAGYWSMITASKRTIIAGAVLGTACGFQMFVMKGLQIKFGVQNFGELMKRMGHTFGLSIKGTVFDPGYWYVTTQEAQWVGWMTQKLGIENMDNIFYGVTNGIPNPLFNPADWMTIGLLGGAAIMALYSNEFKWKKPTMELAFWAIIGGALMGIGSRLAMGCNVGAFLIRISNGNPSGWLFGIGMIGGAFIGVKVFNWYTERKMAKEMEAF